jgi:membrane-bound lytic murein transglycosylase B
VKTIAVLLMLCAAGTLAAQSPAAPASPSTRPSFAEWLSGVRSEAIARGIKEDIVDAALADVEEPLPVVLERDRTQAETVLSLEAYLSRQLTTRRIRTGRDMVARHRETLEKVSSAYGVPVKIIAGIWGMESNFGRFSGVRPTIAALATLAWDPRRATYFRGELFNALEILNRGDIDLGQLKGSWAGAMGQPQFMPSSYLEFAVDFDGDGRRDIWTTPADVFASIANYLKGHGWDAAVTWGREVTIPQAAARRIAATVARRDGSCKATRDMTVALPLAEWEKLGVRRLGGGALPKADVQAALVSGSSRHFLVYPNYDALLQYNCAHPYALSVALLGERLDGPAPVARAPRPAARPRKRPASRRR